MLSAGNSADGLLFLDVQGSFTARLQLKALLLLKASLFDVSLNLDEVLHVCAGDFS